MITIPGIFKFDKCMSSYKLDGRCVNDKALQYLRVLNYKKRLYMCFQRLNITFSVI